jgi:diadenosine tetraphosphate (Ap4A) HIT family hydrolase
MSEPTPDCTLCRGIDGDPELGRVEVWRDDLWRLTVATDSEVPGFAFLEPIRHIPHVTDLGGPEAETFGAVLGRVTTALKEATGTELVYVYVFGGGIPHLHVHLAPHREGDALSTQLIRGEIVEEHLPSGATRVTSLDFPPIPQPELRAVADRVRGLLAD